MASVDVSVIVPVYNPGVAIDRCVDSLLAQTLPSERLEIIFVDDGSTDGTERKLDRLASRHPNVSVIHIPNSGWPGRPRNLGIEAAAGHYVQFVDHDDEMGPEALERLFAMGVANDADIIIGKVTSDFRPVPHELFRENIGRCSITDAPLIYSLTPHKMIRRDFLLDTGIRYPEGKVRLEDQLFMVKCYFATDSVAVLADYPCYFYSRRVQGRHASTSTIDPVSYYRNLADVLDVVEANTTPGEFRNSLYRRFLRTTLRRLAKTATAKRSRAFVTSLLAEVQSMAARFPTEVADGLTTLRRYEATAMTAGRLDQLVYLTRRSRTVTATVRLEALTRTGSGWTAKVNARMVHPDGSPVVVHPLDGGWVLDRQLVPNDLPVRADSTDEVLASARADAVIHNTVSKVEWFVPSDLEARLEPVPGSAGGEHQIVFAGTADIALPSLAGGRPLPRGLWSVTVRFDALGLNRTGRMAATDRREVDLTPMRRRDGSERVRPRLVGHEDALVLAVGPRLALLRAAFDAAAARRGRGSR